MIHVALVAHPAVLSMAAVEPLSDGTVRILGSASTALPAPGPLDAAVHELLVRLEDLSETMIRTVVFQASSLATLDPVIERTLRRNAVEVIGSPYQTEDAQALALLWADLYR